jgi:hypothetical protein
LQGSRRHEKRRNGTAFLKGLGAGCEFILPTVQSFGEYVGFMTEWTRTLLWLGSSWKP